MLEAKLGVTGAEQKSVDLLPAMPILTFDAEFGPPLQSARRAARRLACSTSVLETGRPRGLFLTSYPMKTQTALVRMIQRIRTADLRITIKSKLDRRDGSLLFSHL
jgi:hypothetical protein